MHDDSFAILSPMPPRRAFLDFRDIFFADDIMVETFSSLRDICSI